MRRACLLVGVCAVLSIVGSACMSRPVAETEPRTSNLYVEPVANDVIDKIDLLFMIDNSQSMGDKQKLLAEAVPQLVDRLVVPRCLTASGAVVNRPAASEPCPTGSEPEFRAASDIHIAVITSSLGSHGALNPTGGCEAAPPGDDRGLLLPRVRPEMALNSYNNTGFLSWDAQRRLVPPGETDAERLGEHFGEMVQAAGETGCGYESSLEAWYRFLIDPEPPLKVAVESGSTVVTEIDTEVLSQREAFLRPDSLLAIVMLTDENDCSVMDEAAGWRLADRGAMVRANSACARDPNDPCCAPCSVGTLPNCPSVEDDPVCKAGDYLTMSKDPTVRSEDTIYQRCLQNKRRFGYDFLYPTSRYVDALTKPLVRKRSTGEMVENPLFKKVPGLPRREQSLVYLAGIVGVPWQDIADDASREGPGLRYLSAAELTAKDRWSLIVGDSAKNQPPRDPFMHEQTEPRSGTNPVTGHAIVSEDSLDPRANPINGHEQRDLDGTDLQFACTFPLREPEPCVEGEPCDCQGGPGDNRNSPLCQPPTTGPAGTTQYYGKAYPGLRPLEVLRGIGDSAIVASICPKVLTKDEPGYGYEPAVDAIIERLKTALGGSCPPRPLAVVPDSDGKLPCVVVEAQEVEGTCSCAAAGRSPAGQAARKLVEGQLRERGRCDGPDMPACSALCYCEIAQATGMNRDECQNSTVNTTTPGYCYVDPFGEPPVGNPELVKDCGPANKRLIRFVGPDTPAPGADAYIACMGATLH